MELWELSQITSSYFTVTSLTVIHFPWLMLVGTVVQCCPETTGTQVGANAPPS